MTYSPRKRLPTSLRRRPREVRQRKHLQVRSVAQRRLHSFPRMYFLVFLQSVPCMKQSSRSGLRETPTPATKSRRRHSRHLDGEPSADVRLTDDEDQHDWPNLDADGDLQHCSQPRRSKERTTVRFRILEQLLSPLHALRHDLARRRREASSSRLRTRQTEMQAQMRPSRGTTPSPPPVSSRGRSVGESHG